MMVTVSPCKILVKVKDHLMKHLPATQYKITLTASKENLSQEGKARRPGTSRADGFAPFPEVNREGSRSLERISGRAQSQEGTIVPSVSL